MPLRKGLGAKLEQQLSIFVHFFLIKAYMGLRLIY